MFGISMILDAYGRPARPRITTITPGWVQDQVARQLRRSAEAHESVSKMLRVAELYASMGETPLASTVVGNTVAVRVPERYRCS